jgi:hypothetical protein
LTRLLPIDREDLQSMGRHAVTEWQVANCAQLYGAVSLSASSFFTMLLAGFHVGVQQEKPRWIPNQRWDRRRRVATPIASPVSLVHAPEDPTFCHPRARCATIHSAFTASEFQ